MVTGAENENDELSSSFNWDCLYSLWPWKNPLLPSIMDEKQDYLNFLVVL